MPSKQQVEAWRATAEKARGADVGVEEGVTYGLDLAYEAHEAVPAMADMLTRAMRAVVICAYDIRQRAAEKGIPLDENNLVFNLEREWRGDVAP